MCGFTGFLSPKHDNQLYKLVGQMVATIQHRGPDNSGQWVDEELGVALGHRRLAVVDLSPAGDQPMISPSGRWVISYNGEIYNHSHLRQELDRSNEAPAWRGHSDTETILACIDAWGVERTLDASVGMFAFALWDREERVLVLARDRMGEKPLYYGWQDDVFLFGSELKALKAHPSFSAAVDRGALSLLLRHNCVPAPYSIYQGIKKLLPGHLLRIPYDNTDSTRELTPVRYWHVNEIVESGLSDPFAGSASTATDDLERLLLSGIGEQMIADVPLGAFLSGGIDSSTVVALMQAQSDRPVKTFTIGFEEGAYDEAVHARAVAKHLGTEHTELYVSPDDARAVIPDIPSIYCEPFGDSSQIPTFLVSQLARGHVTVALSGDGGDELFGGYNRYLMARRVWGRARKLPAFMRRAVAHLLRAVPPANWDRVFSRIESLLPKRMHISTAGDKVHKFADVLAYSDGATYFRQLTSHWNDPASVVIDGQEPITLLTDPDACPKVDCFEHWMMAMDVQTYMADDILVKIDRAAMANSLETRIPMLDHRIAEFAWRMPIDFKIRDGQGKWLLRQVLQRYVPNELIDRPKMGFGIPLDSWLRGPLREWAEDLLGESRLRSEGYFHPGPIRAMWAEHIDGKRNWQHHLWTVLMYQAWLSENQTRLREAKCIG